MVFSPGSSLWGQVSVSFPERYLEKEKPKTGLFISVTISFMDIIRCMDC
jgi:hypothetical protein